MGVMQCSRRGCDEILCDRCILGNTRYICAKCFDELDVFRYSWPLRMTALEVRQRIEDFMDSPVGAHAPLNPEDVRREFDRLTGTVGTDT